MTRLTWHQVAPEGAKALYGVHHYVTKSTNLPEELIHLVFLRVSQINGCAHCIDMHGRDLRKTMSGDKVSLLPVWDDLVDLTITIAAMNAFNRLGAPFRLPVSAKA